MKRQTGRNRLRRLSAVKQSRAVVAAQAIAWKALRERAGLTQEQLAKMLGLSFATVNRKENGRSPITQIEMAALRALSAARVA